MSSFIRLLADSRAQLSAPAEPTSPPPRFRVTGLRIHARTEAQREPDEQVLDLIAGGVTGHESWYVDADFVERNRGSDFVACTGCRSWDRLVVSAEQMKPVLDAILAASPRSTPEDTIEGLWEDECEDFWLQ